MNRELRVAPGAFQASSIEIGRCPDPNCSSIHLVLQDARGMGQAQAVIPLRRANAVCEEIIKAAIATEPYKAPGLQGRDWGRG